MEARQTFTAPPTRASVVRRAWRPFKRWLYWFHRWLGVVTCLLCVMWFVTGLVMLYVPFPSFGDAERVATLPAVAVSDVRVLPDEALSKAGVGEMPSTFRLEMFAGEPVYRIIAGDKRSTISAASGNEISGVTAELAARHLVFTYPASRPDLRETLDYDQWTPTKRFDPHRPLYRFALNDNADTTVYVSS